MYDPEHLEKALERGWNLEINDDGSEIISKLFEFDSFNDVIKWINVVVHDCVSLNHHPLLTNNFKTVYIELTTHESKGLSDLDFKLALLIDRARSFIYESNIVSGKYG